MIWTPGRWRRLGQAQGLQVLEQFTITGGACFGDDPLVLKPLQSVNLFFGPNGSGKTTISRALAGNESLATSFVWHDSAPLAVKVYNRDFVNRTLRESDRIPGVFVVGDKSVEAEVRLAAIEGDRGERAQAESMLSRAENSLNQANIAAAEATSTFLETCWSAYKVFTDENPALKPAFTGAGGVGNSKQTLVDRLVALDPPDEPVPSLDSLVASADAVFAATSALAVELRAIPSLDVDQHEGHKLLGVRVVGSGTITLSEIVDQLGNSDWVSKGRTYLHDADGLCPFCQQVAPADLVANLASMFDDHYVAQCADIEAFSVAFGEWQAQVAAVAEAPEVALCEFVDRAGLQAALREIEAALARNSAVLAIKASTPSESVRFEPVGPAVKSLNDIFDSANAGVRAHNKLVANRRTERPRLVTDCWRFLAEARLGSAMSSFSTKQAARMNGIETLKGKVEKARATIANLDDEVRGLHRSVESTQPVIEKINGVLERSGFTTFKIVESTSLSNGYMLARGDDEVQEQSLSEGERTFIAFLYYFHLLDGYTEGSDDPPRYLAVIDDPISSLDSDVLFVVGTLVRLLIARASSGDARIEQVIVLTHNVYFHKEIAHLRQGESSGGRTFFLIRKRPSSPSTVESSRRNPIETEYGRLWAEVRRAIDGEAMNIIGLENILRRILESYFRVMGGGIWDDEITPLLNVDEGHVFRALFRWVNDGSHSVIEDAYYSPSLVSQDLYLQVFERIFVVTKHEAHYRMMLYGRKSLDELGEEDGTPPLRP